MGGGELFALMCYVVQLASFGLLLGQLQLGWWVLAGDTDYLRERGETLEDSRPAVLEEQAIGLSAATGSGLGSTVAPLRAKIDLKADNLCKVWEINTTKGGLILVSALATPENRVLRVKRIMC